MKTDHQISLGKFLFRFRSFTTLPLLVMCLAFFKPLVVPTWLAPLGLLLSILGETVRIVAVGWSYGGTSGRESYLRADNLNTSGIYSVTRNPLYIGNILIFFGLTLLYGNFWVTLFMLLFLILQYHLIVLAEETYLLEKYGAQYESYLRTVPRFMPQMKGISAPQHTFSWRKVLLKENDSIFNMGVVAWGIVQYRSYLIAGTFRNSMALWLPICLWIIVYLAVKIYKKRYAVNK